MNFDSTRVDYVFHLSDDILNRTDPSPIHELSNALSVSEAICVFSRLWPNAHPIAPKDTRHGLVHWRIGGCSGKFNYLFVH